MKEKKTQVEKGENDAEQHFLLFSQCFQTHSISGSLQLRNILQRIKVLDCILGNQDHMPAI